MEPNNVFSLSDELEKHDLTIDFLWEMFDSVLEWIRKNMKPNEVFSDEQLQEFYNQFKGKYSA